MQTLFKHHTALHTAYVELTECRHIEFTNNTEMTKHKKFIYFAQTESLRNIKRHYKNYTKNFPLFWLLGLQ